MRRWGSVIAAAFCLLASSARADEMPEPPAPVVERTVTIRLLDPDGEPVEGVPLRVETAFLAWHRAAWSAQYQGVPRSKRPEYEFEGPNASTDADGIARTSVQFFDRDWRFRVSYSPPNGRSAKERFPDFSFFTIEQIVRVMDLPSEMYFEIESDPSMTLIEIRLERRITARTTLKGRVRAGRDFSACLMELPDPTMLVWFADGAAQAKNKIEESRANFDGDREIEFQKRFSARQQSDHLLWAQIDGSFARCWLIPSSRFTADCDLGEFEMSHPDFSGVLDVRCTSATDPGHAAGDSGPPRGKGGTLTLVLVAKDASYFVVRELFPQDDFRSRPIDPESGEPIFEVAVPPGDYYVMDGHPSDGMPRNLMRFRFLVELLRGHRPAEGEIPSLTIDEGKSTYSEIDLDQCYNALKAWHDKRFAKVDVPGF